MNSIPLSDIIIENRQRRSFDESSLKDLSLSIRSKGLLHPIVLREDGHTLVAGERRIRAIALLVEQEVSIQCGGVQIPIGHVPFVPIGDLSEEQIVEAELEENVLREDLSVQERAAAVQSLHNLRIAQHGEYNPGRKEGWSAKDTASEIFGRPVAGAQVQTEVKENLLIAQNLDDPEVAKAKTKKEALKIIARKAEAALRERLAEQFLVSSVEHEFFLGEFQNNLPPRNSIDIICTDPLYGIGADTFGDQAGAEHEYSDSYEHWQQTISDFATEARYVTKQLAHVYAFCDPRRFTEFKEFMEAHGFDVWPTPLIWDKVNQGMLPRPDHGPRRCYETILYAIKGNKRTIAVHRDVINIPGLQAPKFGAEKPVALYENLLRRSASPGDRVWDPFIGAGPIFAAANRTNCTVFGTELIKEKFDYAKLRMEEE